MNEKKLRLILESLHGITYLEWEKLKMSVDGRFRAKFQDNRNKTVIPESKEIVEEYKHYSSTI